MNLFDKLHETVTFLQSKTTIEAKDALILGSGLGALANELEDSYTIPYSEIPYWPTAKVEGHAGNLVFGKIKHIPVIMMQGRSHYYEGWSAAEVTYPVRVFAALKIERLLVTNSAGGVNPDLKPGNLMLITDHLNLTGYNPLIGPNDTRLGPRFPDMTYAYNPDLCDAIRRAAKSMNLQINEGVYAGFTGPTYETPAEVKMASILGASAVGMSTVPEVIVGNHAGLKCAGISCITNMAAGITGEKLHHEEVKETANKVRKDFIQLVKTYLLEVHA